MTLQEQLPETPRVKVTEEERLKSEAKLKALHQAQKMALEEVAPFLDVPATLVGHAVRGNAPAKEKFWHRTAEYLAAAGYTAQEIAEATGYSEDQVKNLQKAPWFQAAVTDIIHKSGGSDIMTLIKAQQQKALSVLVEVLDNPKAPANTRAAVANSILDRVMGKATQRVEHAGTIASSDPVAEMAQLEDEVRRLREAKTGGAN